MRKILFSRMEAFAVSVLLYERESDKSERSDASVRESECKIDGSFKAWNSSRNVKARDAGDPPSLK